MATRWGGMVDDIAGFDAAFFGVRIAAGLTGLLAAATFQGGGCLHC